jgi:hypothetical protein
MITIRARLAACAIALLACQAASLSAAPVVLCRSGQSLADDLDECCRKLAPGQTCPMHHKTHGAPDRRTPTWACVCSPSDALLASIVGVVGYMPPPVLEPYAPVHVVTVIARSSSTLERQQTPLSPPPRG